MSRIPNDLLVGIIAGHLYSYLKELRLLNTPQWLLGCFPNTSIRVIMCEVLIFLEVFILDTGGVTGTITGFTGIGALGYHG